MQCIVINFLFTETIQKPALQLWKCIYREYFFCGQNIEYKMKWKSLVKEVSTYWGPPGCASARWVSGCCWADRSTLPRPGAGHRGAWSHSRYIWNTHVVTPHFSLTEQLSSWPVHQPVLVVDLDWPRCQQPHSILPGDDVCSSGNILMVTLMTCKGRCFLPVIDVARKSNILSHLKR